MNYRDKIINSNDIEKEAISIPEWGLEEGVFVKTLTAGQKSDLETSATKVKKDKKGNVDIDIDFNQMKRAKVLAVIMSLCDENGTNMLTVDDMEMLMGKSSLVVSRIYDVASRLSHLDIDKEQSVKN